MYLRYDDIVTELRKAVEVRGADYVYPNEWEINEACQYVIDGQPACIVGQVFAQLGFDVTRLEGYVGGPVQALRRVVEDDVDFDDDAIGLLTRAQWYQDIAVPWGKAVAKAIEDVADGVLTP